jgi:hypothetical protein
LHPRHFSGSTQIRFINFLFARIGHAGSNAAITTACPMTSEPQRGKSLIKIAIPVPLVTELYQQIAAVVQLGSLPSPLRANIASGSLVDSCVRFDRFSP